MYLVLLKFIAKKSSNVSKKKHLVIQLWKNLAVHRFFLTLSLIL